MKKLILFYTCSIFLLYNITAQNTIGLLSYEPNKSYEGYNLFYPNHQEKVFLVNNCGEIVHIWHDDEDFRPGNMAYLRDDGSLVKSKRHNNATNDPLWAGGGGGIVEIQNWDNEVLWSFEQNNATQRLHHDIEPMPNGNILMISWELKSTAEVIQAGRNPSLLSDNELWPDYILEVNPTTNEIVWEWHAWDHLVQEFDINKANFGTVANHPELIDFNWVAGNGPRDWLHTNAIDYNATLDQIVISVPSFNEIWIIDHSTTTEEAAGHSGGMSNRGGDLLYRWGNPITYQAGTIDDQKLFFQHDIHWVGDFLDTSHPHFGKLALFNNQVNPDYSTANVFAPVFDTATWSYLLEDESWEPDDFDMTITHPEPEKMRSARVSGFQLLPNGNSLICVGSEGYTFELTPENDIAWEYLTPFAGGNPATQGENVNLNNLTFRFNRYPIGYPAFAGRDLSPMGYIELNPDTTFCDLISPVNTLTSPIAFTIFPNPATNEIQFKQTKNTPSIIEIFNYTGEKIHTFEIFESTQKINTSNWTAGLYFAIINSEKILKFVLN